MIIDFDQTPLSYVCTRDHTLHFKGDSSVPLKGKGKTKQITGTFAVLKFELFLPMQIIYEGKTTRCLPKNVEFPEGFNVTFTPNHWSNEEKVIEYLNEIIFPYCEAKREELDLPPDQKALLIYDVFKGQKTDRVYDLVEENDCVSRYGPNNLTDQFQPLDLITKNMAKKFLNDKSEQWYADQISSQLDGGLDIYDVDVKTTLTVMKPIHARWLIGLYDYLRNNPDSHKKGFKLAGIDEALDAEFEIEPEDPFHDLL